MIQKHLNQWFSLSLDLHGSEVSSNAASYFANGLKGRALERGLLRQHPSDIDQQRDRRRTRRIRDAEHSDQLALEMFERAQRGRMGVDVRQRAGEIAAGRDDWRGVFGEGTKARGRRDGSAADDVEACAGMVVIEVARVFNPCSRESTG